MVTKRWALIFPAVLALLLAACGSDEPESTFSPSAPVEVKFSLEPSEPKSGDTVTFAVTVTQEGQPVDDASEVNFEWWKEGDEQHKTVPATFQKDGLYIARQTVDEPGSYYVYYHVTARDFHSMKRTPFTVVAADGEADTNDTGEHAHEHSGDAGHTDSHADEHESGDSGHAHGHDSQVDMHFAPSESIRASEEASLAVHVMHEDQALSKATVRFEYWRDGEQLHHFLDAPESQPGMYEAKVSFPASGSYTVKVHVEAPDIHDHQEFPLSVQ
ncbi:FixH family protein [Brevibacillus sp. TJ4]|uniref:FixH family protein n=1 Tax=Brevibacillus sp. TJ4 TaxID=3234853 RepID=UPI0037D615B1